MDNIVQLFVYCAVVHAITSA